MGTEGAHAGADGLRTAPPEGTIAAISVTPGRRRIGLYWKTDPRDYIDALAMVGILRDLLRHLKGKVIVVWDRGSNHKGPAIRALLQRFPRLTLERLPGYAPDLNPVEMLWAYLKHGLMANFVAADVLDLERVVLANMDSVRADPKLIRSLWRGSDLPDVPPPVSPPALLVPRRPGYWARPEKRLTERQGPRLDRLGRRCRENGDLLAV